MTPDDYYEARNSAHLDALVEHYAWIASMDKHYAWARVKELAAQPLDFYKDLPDLLTKTMRQRLNAPTTETGRTNEHSDSSPTLARFPIDAKPQQRTGMARTFKFTP